MLSEILKIIPKVDQASLKSMERTMNTRFGRIAKRFGKGLAGSLAGGGFLGVALGLIDKLLNPIKEVQEAIDRTLKYSGDVVSNSEQFGTTPGQLFKLQKLAQTKGLDEEGLYMLISKFQTAVAEAQQDPSKPSAVANYTGFTDMAEGFFAFIQSLQKLEKSQQILVQQQVFGEKQILKMADFLNTNFEEQVKALGIGDTTAANNSLMKLDKVADLADLLQAQREYKDIVNKGGVVNEGLVRARDKSERMALEKENQRIASYQNLAAISDTVTKIMGLIENQISLLGSLVKRLEPAITAIIGLADRVQKSKFVRNIFGLGKGE